MATKCWWSSGVRGLPGSVGAQFSGNHWVPRYSGSGWVWKHHSDWHTILCACFIPHRGFMSSTMEESEHLNNLLLTWIKTRLRLIEPQSCSPFFLLSAFSQNLSFCGRCHFDICHFWINWAPFILSSLSLSLSPELHHDCKIVTPGRVRAAHDPWGRGLTTRRCSGSELRKLRRCLKRRGRGSN